MSFNVPLRPCAPVDTHYIDRLEHNQIEWRAGNFSRGKADHQIASTPPCRAQQLFGKGPARIVQNDIGAFPIGNLAYCLFRPVDIRIDKQADPLGFQIRASTVCACDDAGARGIAAQVAVIACLFRARKRPCSQLFADIPCKSPPIREIRTRDRFAQVWVHSQPLQQFQLCDGDRACAQDEIQRPALAGARLATLPA